MPILYQGGEIQVQVYVAAEHDVANADVLIWATHQSLAAPDRGLPSSQFVRFPPRQLLSAIKRAIGNRDHQPLNGALTRLQATAIRSTIRLAEPWRCRQISRINEWRQLISRSGRVEGMEFVLPESFCRSALDRRRVLALDAAYFALSVGIERWLYRLARSTRSGSQTARISGFGISVGRARVSHVSDFALDIGRIVARQLVRKLSPSAEKHCAESDRRKARPIVGTALELCSSTDLMVRGRAPSAAKTRR
jgi:plasmid replication initiation protein